MAQIVNTYVQHMPALRLIGKSYGPADWVDGSFGHKWGEWWQNDWFGTLEKRLADQIPNLDGDEDAYVGAFISWPDHWEYWIGMLAHAGAQPPQGFAGLDLPQGDIKVAWVKGKEDTGEVYGQEDACRKALAQAGLPVERHDGMSVVIERYQCPRFTTPDADGYIILDICFY